MDRIRQNFSDRYFEHPTVDFECSAKLLLTGREFIYLDRPFSVLGTTAASNSSAMGRFTRVNEINAALKSEDGPRFDVPGFPFTSQLGVTGSILATLNWFTIRYGLPMGGWEENFFNALEMDCSKAEDRESFDRHVAVCRRRVGRNVTALAPSRYGQSTGHATPAHAQCAAGAVCRVAACVERLRGPLWP